MIKKAIEYINGLKPVVIQEINGRQFSTEPLNLVPDKFGVALVDVLEINSLTGIVSYINTNVDEIKLDEAVIHIKNFDSVYLLSKNVGELLQRNIYLHAGISSILEGGFRYGMQYEASEFIIAMQTHFVPSDEVENMVEYLSCMKATDEVKVVDNGLTQTVTKKKSVNSAQIEDSNPKNPVTLKPYRTFLELEQPESQFVFRVQGGERPTASLHEADSGKWKLDAIELIKNWLVEKGIEIPIIA